MTFEKWDKVLVRNSLSEVWNAAIFDFEIDEGFVCSGKVWKFCIPYNGNTHLIQTCSIPITEN